MRRYVARSIIWSASVGFMFLGVCQTLSGCSAVEDLFHPPDAVSSNEAKIGDVNFRLQASLEDGVVAYLIQILQEGVVVEERLQVLDTEPLTPGMAGGDDHRFADAYFVLAPGFYDIVAKPMEWDEVNQTHVNSTICTDGTSENVEVKSGKTTEVVIFSQCSNPDNGGLDVVVAINHAPIIEKIVFDPSKFVVACEEVVVRTTISEPDGDEYTMSWTSSAPDGAVFDLAENGDLLSFIAETPGDYEVSLTVCDTLQEPNQMCATLSMPIHVTLGEDENGNGIGDGCEPEICEPNCVDRECGPDPECGESCGSCGENQTCNVDGLCECDFEECNGVCCVEGEVCENDLCTAPCQPLTCADMAKSCGCWDDGCGTELVCGTCEANQLCNDDGQCQCEFQECNGVCCAEDQECVDESCVGICQSQTCEEMGKQCGSWDDGCGTLLDCGICSDDKICGDDGLCVCAGVDCNGVCCGSDESCVDELCQKVCVPKTCEELGKECGTWDDGCGGQTECATCGDNKTCTDEGTCKTRSGRVVTILLTMSNPRTDINDPENADRTKLITQSVDWVSPVDTPRILIVRDDNHSGEFPEDPAYIKNLMVSRYADVTLIDEPPCGLMPSELENVDVVWFSNPGHPVDDECTVHTLYQFVHETGGGLVLQGDDMTWRKDMEPLTRLHFERNGTHYCGVYINDNKSADYQVTLESIAHPVIDGLQTKQYLYGDDIDHSSFISDPKAVVLAWATLPSGRMQNNPAWPCDKMPVVVAFDPHDTTE